MTPPDAAVFCTTIAKAGVPQARALARSVRRHHPGAAVVALLLDRPDGLFDPAAEPFRVLPLADLGVPDCAALRFGLAAADLACAAKPYLIEHLLRSARRVVYLDADLEVLRPLDPLLAPLGRRAAVVGPHVPPATVTPPAPSARPLPEAGLDDPGSVAVARGERAAALIDWWKARARVARLKTCDNDPFARDRWLDFTPDLLRRGGPPPAAWPYSWAAFANGLLVPDQARAHYRNLKPAAAAAFGDPFAVGPGTFFAWLTAFDGPLPPPVFRFLYDKRTDLHPLWPDMPGADRAAFLEWCANHGVHEHAVDPGFLRYVRPEVCPPPAPPARPVLAAAPAGGPPTEPFGVNVLGFMQSEKGLGEATRATVRAVRAAGVPCALNNWVDGGSTNLDTTHAAFAADNPYPVNLIHLNADATPWLLERTPGYFARRYNIGFWNWELEWFPEQWHPHFAHYDEVWAPSAFTRNSVAKVSPVPVHRVPFAVTAPVIPPHLLSRARFGLPAREFVFLFAFDFHSYFARKNPLAAVEAFRRAFGGRRDVHLLLKSSRAEHAPREFAEVLAACRGQANIRIMRDVLARDELNALMALADGYLALHRSEGYGLPIAEAMALGKPVVATDYSANVDFMDESNSFPVRYSMTTIDEDHGPYRKGEVWAEPDVGHAAEQLRRVVDDPARTAAVAARAAADIARTLSPAAVGRTIRGRLEAIHGRGRPAGRRAG